jgi:hypothetical protein
MAETVDVFFYGLFMDAEALRAKGLHPVNGRKASVSGMSLRIGQRATLVADPGKTVHGFIMGLSHEEIDGLYAEPSVADYRAEPVMAELADGARVPALCFNLPPAKVGAEANPDYAAKLRTLATRLGLPADYVAGIQ